MAIFDDVELEWEGVKYTLKGDGQIMKAIAAVEDSLTLAELFQGQESGRIPLAKLSMAYAILLRHAGARQISDAEVYAGMWANGADASAIQEAITSLLALMMPQSVLDNIQADEGGDAEPSEGSKKKPETPSS